jgi:hypothetical protein
MTLKEIEESFFVLAIGMIGYYSEHGSVDRYVDDTKFAKSLSVAQTLNPTRFEKEIEPFL